MLPVVLKIFLAFSVAMGSALFVIPKLATIANAIGLVDIPNGRKLHHKPRPLVGGIGIVIAATFSCLLVVDWSGFRGLFAGLALLLFVGFLDDFRELGSSQKFIAQIGATALMIFFSNISLGSFGDLLGLGDIVVPGPEIISWCVTIFCVVGVINALNMMDGLDGLAGGVSLIAFLTFAFHALYAGKLSLALINIAFAGALVGFLRFNWSPSKVFMGDAGSLTLGFGLAFMAIITTQGEGGFISPVVPLLILAVPITDTVIVMTRRVIRGNSPFLADKYHLHHLLVRFGFDMKTSVGIILIICVVLSLVATLFQLAGVADYYLFGVFLLYFTANLFFSYNVISIMRFSLRRKN